jgi:heme oxygenase (biliverdin-IX-beta and delta-forming)
MSATLELRSATRKSHQDLEKRLDVKTRFATLAGYSSHLRKMWGFYASFEQVLGTQSFGGGLSDYDARRKLPLLTQDLISLGNEHPQVLSLAVCATTPSCANPAAAFGCLYVLEGATLGGQTLSPMMHKRFGLTADCGAAFLCSYGAEVVGMWQRFIGSLDAWCFTPERRAVAARAAVATFKSLDEWLRERPA